MTIAYTTGVFDILHKGHINVLNEARKLADTLLVGVQDAESIFRTKGRYPTLSNLERTEQLKLLPFVDDVFIYTDIDQRPNLERIRPDVMVQGDDWLRTGDRTKILEYLNQNNIRLVLIPYTQGVSSTELKKRLIDASHLSRKDDDFIAQRMKLFRVGELKTYEKYDEKKVLKLIKKIKKEKYFSSPITVTNMTIIDGINRFEAIKRLGFFYISAFVVDYNEEVESMGNVHYVRAALNDVLPEKTEKITIAEAIEGLKRRYYSAFIDDSKYAYAITYEKELEERVKTINRIVLSYLGKFQVARLSEFVHETGTRVVFGKFSEKELLELTDNDLKLQSGIIWHRQKYAIARLPIPVSLLKEGFDMRKFVNNKSENGEIRYYPHNIYICGEW